MADWFEYIKFGGTLVAGGVGGNILNYFIGERKNKPQPVGKKLTVSYIYVPSELSIYEVNVTLKHKANLNVYQQDQHFKNLSVISLELVNYGNKDFDKLKLGINFPKNTVVIEVKGEGKDRYHTVKQVDVSELKDNFSEVDILFEPFNKEDKYNVTFIVAGRVEENQRRINKDDIKFSHAEPIRFVDMDWKSERKRKIRDKIITALLLLFVIVLLYNRYFAKTG